MRRYMIQLAGIAITLLIFSCDKEDGDSETKAVFSYVADGFVVNFTNFSTEATEYLWDFGDGTGETSTRKSPQYVFKAKGDYLVSLTAKNGDLTSTFIDTVTIIGPNIKIDGDFTDWEHVEYNIINEGTSGGTISSVKTFASPTHLNFLLEGTMDMEFAILQVYLDTDKNPATGYPGWQYPAGSGADYKLEGSITDEWGGLQVHSGNPADDWGGFSGDIASFPEVIDYSEMKTTEGKNVIEFSVKRNVLGTLAGSLNFAIIEATSAYLQIGAIPANQYPEAKYGAFPL
ncbi:PKD domain-containing protein [Sphingobacterium phlebotomi]|uniref:PKD domain-containing protein n=1 Tax=Sphingobacterium phlebotomi TaxID=2605433 RepID=A0A5D4H4Y3_9SPHI|nr:PKD domain-containing protein [Sphingobacterium phlebotomi]TYR33860.1 PKD domain-containing protein [Sphingobacterium phlebotomi]